MAPMLPETPFNLNRLLLGDINRLRYVSRFSTALVLHRENNAEHTFYVGLYALYIAQWYEIHWSQPPQPHVPEINYGKMLSRVLMHDLDEAGTGDFNHRFKYSNPDLTDILKKAAKIELARVVSGVFDKKDDATWIHQCIWWWDFAKDGSIEGRILALADFLAVLGHMWQEINCANVTMYDHYDDMIKYVQRFEDPKYDLLRPIVDQARHYTFEVIGKQRKETF